MVSKKILAFRTITRMLDKIQQERPLKIADAMPTESEGLQLKISNAFANLAIIDHEVVALVGKLDPDKLEVIASIEVSDKTPLTQPSPFSQFWDYIITKNFRRGDPKPDTLDPSIISPECPQGLKSEDDKAVKQYVADRWSHPIMPNHLWILSRLLLMKEPDLDPQTALGIQSTRLTEYMIATCFPKILYRLENLELSRPYIDSLKQVGLASIKGLLLKSGNNEPQTPKEIESDRLFLCKFLLTLMRSGPSISILYTKTKVTNLIKQAMLAEKREAFELYSSKTCEEFHLLFIELIDRFLESLSRLKLSRGESSCSTLGTPAFELNVGIVRMYGYALQRLARGSALRMHLKVITPLLDNLGRKKDKICDDSEEQVKYKEQYREDEEELRQVQPFVTTEDGVPKPLWQSYRDWLRLIMVHFDAVEILIAYVTAPAFQQKTISIKILVAPHLDASLLPWSELFTDSTFFPNSVKVDPQFDENNKKILIYLRHATDSNPKSSLDWAKGARKWLNKGDHKKVQQLLSRIIIDSELPGWRECAKSLSAALTNAPQPLDKLSSTYRDINNSMQTLHDNGNFFCSLEDNSFLGTLHCEASLASFLRYGVEVDVMARDQISMKDFGRVISVSKRCCPTCHHLLSLLAPDSKSPFLVRGSHNTITACTLPTWIPEHIVDSMNDHFGTQLRRELLDLMGRSELMRSRVHSTGSQRLSLDSATGPSGDNGDIISSDIFIKLSEALPVPVTSVDV